MATKTKLYFTPPSGVVAKYSLDRAGTYVVGTGKRCDIKLDDPDLEEEHGKLVADETNEGRWFLQILADKSILMLEDDTEHKIGGTNIDVQITEVEEEESPDDDEANEEEDDDDNAAAPVRAADEELHNESQLDALKKAQQLRELKSAVILVIVCGILAFAAGIAWRLIRLP